jgi:hypothetical protein
MLMASPHRQGKSGAAIIIEYAIVLIVGIKRSMIPFDSGE